jgi:small nuclear ribonucleoprotein (snRNP)-like protein
MTVEDAYARYLGETVVLDTASTLVYMGRLRAVDDYFLILEDVDVHDVGEAQATKSLVVMEARRDGVVPNRDEVSVKQSAVLSISRIDSVRIF